MLKQLRGGARTETGPAVKRFAMILTWLLRQLNVSWPTSKIRVSLYDRVATHEGLEDLLGRVPMSLTVIGEQVSAADTIPCGVIENQ